MKKKTSISVSHQLLKMIDSLPDRPPRSAVIEEALVLYFKEKKRQKREKSDFETLNALSKDLNSEALEVLNYQSV